MREVIDYALIYSDSRDNFTAKVTEAIKNGWQLYGPLIHQEPVGKAYAYARELVKYKPTTFESISDKGENNEKEKTI